MTGIEDYIELIRNFIVNTDDSVLYLALNQSLMNELYAGLGEEFLIFDLKNDTSPVKPFFKIVKDLKIPENELSDEFYSLQQRSALSFLQTGKAQERYDPIFEQEFFYESCRMQQSLVNLIEKHNGKNYLFLNAQFMFSEGFEILKQLEKSKVHGKIIFCFDSINSEFGSQSVSSFMDLISNKRNFLHIMVNEDLNKISDKNNFLDSSNYNHFTAYKDITSFEQILTNLKNYRLLCAYEQASDFCTWTIQTLQKQSFTHAQKRLIYTEIAQIQYEVGNPDESILYLNNIIDYQYEDDLETWAFYYMARVFSKKKSNTVAQKYAILVQQKLSNRKNDKIYALAVMMEYFVINRHQSLSVVQKYRESLKLLEKAGLINSFIATAVKIPWTLISDPNETENLFEILDKCFEYSQQIGNKHLYSSSAHWKAIVLSHSGQKEEAMEYLDECNRIRTEIGEIGPLLAIRNGLSYESLNRALYPKAYNTVNDISEKLYQVKDFSTIIDTLKNLSYSVFFMRHFDVADKIFSIIIYFLNLFRLTNSANNSFLPSVNDILIYRSLVSLHNNDFIHAKMNYLSITQNSINIASVDKPLLHFLRAVLLIEEKKIGEACEEFDLGEKEFFDSNENQEHKVVFMYFEFAKYLARFFYNKESDYYLKKGIELAKKYGFEYYTKGKESITVNEYIAGAQEMEPVKINLQFLVEKAEKDKLLNQLHGRIHEYQFLNKIRSFNSDNIGIKKYLEKVCSAISEYTMTRRIIIAENVQGSWKRLYSVAQSGEKTLSDNLMSGLFAKALSQADCQLFYDNDMEVYCSNLSKYDFSGGIIIVPGQLGLLDAETINILNISLTNIQAKIVMVRQNEHLLFVSSTDQLSLLKNRHSLQEHLAVEGERISRFYSRKHVLLQCTIAFIDLDNFKWYNDTFGHNIGDLFIKCFASLLKKTLRKLDFTARYGGDEFVIVMSDTNIEEGVRVQQRLMEGLTKANFFIPQLRDAVNSPDLFVPAERHLGFSMGLCSNLDLDDMCDLARVMDYADKALYYVKQHEKGRLAIWSEIKDEIENSEE